MVEHRVSVSRTILCGSRNVYQKKTTRRRKKEQKKSGSKVNAIDVIISHNIFNRRGLHEYYFFTVCICYLGPLNHCLSPSIIYAPVFYEIVSTICLVKSVYI